MSSIQNDKNKTLDQRMQKRVEKKEDGRNLIFYTFEEVKSEGGAKQPTAKAGK